MKTLKRNVIAWLAHFTASFTTNRNGFLAAVNFKTNFLSFDKRIDAKVERRFFVEFIKLGKAYWAKFRKKFFAQNNR